jgi:hypothetical protein
MDDKIADGILHGRPFGGGGGAVLVRKQLSGCVSFVSHNDDGRVICVEFLSGNIRSLVFGCYFPLDPGVGGVTRLQLTGKFFDWHVDASNFFRRRRRNRNSTASSTRPYLRYVLIAYKTRDSMQVCDIYVNNIYCYFFHSFFILFLLLLLSMKSYMSVQQAVK